MVERTIRWVKNHMDDGAEHCGWWWCCASWPGPSVGFEHPSWDSPVGCPHSRLGVVTEDTHCMSPSDTQLKDASICSRTRLPPKGCRIGLRAPGETQPHAQGGGALAVTAAGVAPSAVQPQGGQCGDGVLSTSWLPHPAGLKPLMLWSTSALALASHPSLNTKVRQLNLGWE